MDLKRILFGLAVALCLVSCQNNGEQLHIKLKQTEYHIGYEGGVIEVEFVAIVGWRVFCWQEGISIAPEGGEETNQTASFTMTIAENLKDSDGLMVFDIVHIITKNLWKEIEAGMRLGGNLK